MGKGLLAVSKVQRGVLTVQSLIKETLVKEEFSEGASIGIHKLLWTWNEFRFCSKRNRNLLEIFKPEE